MSTLGIQGAKNLERGFSKDVKFKVSFEKRQESQTMGPEETFQKEELIYEGQCRHRKENCLSGNVFWSVA